MKKSTYFYTFYQNNSGGYFVRNDNVCEIVIIEAENAEQANEIASNIGIYFNGTIFGFDCSCCGDRWTPVEDFEGKNEPSVYGESVYEYEGSIFKKEAIIYYLDGKKERVKFKRKNKKYNF